MSKEVCDVLQIGSVVQFDSEYVERLNRSRGVRSFPIWKSNGRVIFAQDVIPMLRSGGKYVVTRADAVDVDGKVLECDLVPEETVREWCQPFFSIHDDEYGKETVSLVVKEEDREFVQDYGVQYSIRRGISQRFFSVGGTEGET